MAPSPKLAPILTGHSIHGQQPGGGFVLQVGDENRGGILGNDHHFDVNKDAMTMTRKPNIVAIPIMRNQHP